MATPETLVDLIVSLARYQEEGVRLTPQVYLTNDIDLLVSMLPDGEKLSLGSSSPDSLGVQRMLKVCAPLSTPDWRLFGNQQSNDLAYGLFRGSNSLISVPVDDIIMTSLEDAVVIKVHQVAEECVQIVSSAGSLHHVYFNHRKQESPPPLQIIDKLAKRITKDTDRTNGEAIQTFLFQSLKSALAKSHGSLIAVVNAKSLPVFLSDDAVVLPDPIDFFSLISQIQRDRGAVSTQGILNASVELLEGMIHSDGVTIFDEKARILAYRCFVSTSNKANVVGGARMRAFNAIKGQFGNGISAAFMKSQDGWMEFESND